MKWNWQKPDWPRFTWDPARLVEPEAHFLRASGVFLGMVRHLADEAREELTIDAMSNEAVTTSEIEGEILNRDSVQSSIRQQLDLVSDRRRVKPAEQGIGEMMVDLFRRYAQPLTHETLFAWHRMVIAGHPELRDIGRYRTHAEPMQVISGRIWDPNVHFEALPSSRVQAEMDALIGWFNRTAPGGREPLPALTRAGIAHLYFVSIHPFEDGNGRIGRALTEKALAQAVGQPSLTAIAATILARRGAYYRALEAANKHNEITDWLTWFAEIGNQAQSHTIELVEFLIQKAKLLDRIRDVVNPRQMAVILRMLREGPAGFIGGLSAGNYTTIAKTSPATATRDLAELVELGVLIRTGERRGTRYRLDMPQHAGRRPT